MLTQCVLGELLLPIWALLPTVLLLSEPEVQECKNFRSKPSTSTSFSCSSSSSASFKNLLITLYLSRKVVLVVGYLTKTAGRTVRGEFLFFVCDSSPTSPFCAAVTPHSGSALVALLALGWADPICYSSRNGWKNSTELSALSIRWIRGFFLT